MRAGVNNEGIDNKAPVAKGSRINPIDLDVEKCAKSDQPKFHSSDTTLAQKIVE